MRYLLMVAVLLAVPVWAEPLRVFGYDLDYRLKPSGEGHYNDFLEALQDRGVDIDLTILPLERAIRALEDSVDGCNFPATINAIVRSYPSFSTSELISGDPIDRVSLRVFSRRDEPVIYSLEELENKRVAMWGGLDPNAFLGEVNAQVERTPNETVRVRMLDARRLDVIIGFMPDVMLVAEELNLPLPHFADDLALFHEEGTSIVCRATAENAIALREFNAVLTELKNSGELRTILGPHADIVN